MKYAILSAAAALALATSANAATLSDISSKVDTSAFAKADEEWRVNVIKDTGLCGRAGTKERPIDLLIEQYETLAKAIEANDEAAAMAAGRDFAALVKTQKHIESCWNVLSRKAGVPRSLWKEFA
ncbi:MAG: hypothetical protein VX640_16115 [Pseudomonadota bacterium]|nr:hypothetical protein [Pseudomonadota bacterium]